MGVLTMGLFDIFRRKRGSLPDNKASLVTQHKKSYPQLKIINERDEVVYNLSQELLDSARRKCNGE
jgi:hypothetical protein